MVWPVLIVCFVLGTVAHNAKQAVTSLVDDRTRALGKRVEGMYRDIGDIHGLVRLGPYTQELPLPIGGGWALTGHSAALLAREMLVRQPENILELGSGVSTLVVGQILKRRGKGRLISVDHDPVWADQTRRYVEFLALQDVVTVIDAPLKEVALQDHPLKWYDIPAPQLDAMGPIDFLLVDGPPQPRDTLVQARYPAFPMLRDRLAPSATIFVDDVNRSTEAAMVERWRSEDPAWQAQKFDTVDGVALLTRQL
jgi:predicted O-methyltransferase YrrM